MIPASPSAGQLNALDFRGLADVQRQARSGDPKALRAAAQQFEALFLQMVLKSMRDATPREGMFDSEQSRMYESLLDQQLSQVLSSKRGIGLAAVIEKQLLRRDDLPNGESRPFPLDDLPRALELIRERRFPLAPQVPGAGMSGVELPADLPEGAREFVQRVLPDARLAAAETGIPAHFLVAHAALETGWGRAEPRAADGRPSFNLFGVKAQRGWQGDSVEAMTTEYVQGLPQRRAERFRAYGSYAESFRDYAQLLTASPRYREVLGVQEAGGFARGLQAAGYATDPAYAAKLERVIGMIRPG